MNNACTISLHDSLQFPSSWAFGDIYVDVSESTLEDEELI